ncbi:MAG: hypothetical protein ACI906_003825, partial [Candidatus Latescibacterota bacterium]
SMAPSVPFDAHKTPVDKRTTIAVKKTTHP